jgi:hypothetical protein
MTELEFDHETETAIARLNRDLRDAAASMTPMNRKCRASHHTRENRSPRARRST